MAKKKDTLIDEAKKIQEELAELKKKKEILDAKKPAAKKEAKKHEAKK